MASHDDDARQRWSGRLRPGLAAAAVATILLTVAGESSPASASPAGSAAAGGYLYWANIAPIRNGAGTIGRARLNGTDVNQRFVVKKDFLNLNGVAVGPGRY